MPTIYVFEQKYEKISEFLSENFQVLVVKFSIYLNRCVYVMGLDDSCKLCSEAIYLKCQTLFSEKSKKLSLICHLLILLKVLKVKK